MNITRKTFIGGAAAASFMPISGNTGGKHRLRFGVLSDIHLDLSDIRADSYRRALQGFRKRGADAVLVTGDIAHKGRISQLKQAKDIFDEVFPKESGASLLLLPGNHDWNIPKNRKPEDIGYIAENFAANWEKVLGEKFEPIKKKTVKGFTFILVDWFAVDKVEEWFKEHADELDPDEPLFYAQHPHLKGTCYDSETFFWAHADKGVAGKCLSEYPHAVAFSGHSHYPITDEYSIWQGEFTSLNCGSTWCSSRDYVPVDEKANGPSYAYNRKPELMPRIPVCNEVSPGLLVTVKDSEIAIERHDYLRDLPLGRTWMFPLDASRRPYSPENRVKERAAPHFPVSSSIKVEPVNNVFDVTSPKGEVCRETVPQLRLSFPAASGTGKSRVFGYEIKAFDGGKELFSRFLLAKEFHLPECLTPSRPAFYVDASEISGIKSLKFEVRALERFGRKSTPLTCFFNSKKGQLCQYLMSQQRKEEAPRAQPRTGKKASTPMVVVGGVRRSFNP